MKLQQEYTDPCHIVIMFDSCYAMRMIKSNLVREFNSFVSLNAESSCPGADITAALYGENMKLLCMRAKPGHSPGLTVREYSTSGSSMFCDGGEYALELMRRLSVTEKKDERERVICFFVMNDYNESGHSVSAYHLKERLTEQLDAFDINMVLFGAGQNTMRLMEGKDMIISEGLHIAGYYPDSDGIRKMFECINDIAGIFYNMECEGLPMSDHIEIACEWTIRELFRQPGSAYGKRLREIYARENSQLPGAMKYADLHEEILPMIVFDLQEAETDIYESKTGGVPYLPADMEYPMKYGKPLPFFAQLNLSELDTGVTENMPDHGILQFYVVSANCLHNLPLKKSHGKISSEGS